MRQHGLDWAHILRRAWQRHCAALAAVPDPHGQFPALPLDWYLSDLDDVHIPRQRTNSPGHGR
ncbi:hypothetical protein [Actinophytocola sp. KF-1]